MLLTKTFVARSPIHGLGSFAAEFIPAGTVYWRFVPSFDQLVRKQELPPAALEFAKTWCYAVGDGFVMVMPDNARFTNHSSDPNTRVLGAEAIALRDIQPGEEITENYDESEATLAAYFEAEKPLRLSRAVRLRAKSFPAASRCRAPQRAG